MAAALFAMAIPIVLVRLLDQDTFGHYKQLFLIAGTAFAILTLGLPASLYYFVPRAASGEAGSFHRQTALLLSCLGLLGATLVLSGRPLLERFFDARVGPYVPWIALFIALSVPAALIPVSPMVDRRSRLAASLMITFDLLRSGALITAAVIWRDLLAVLVVACVAMAFQLGAVWAYLAWRPDGLRSQSSLGKLRTQLAYALPFAGTALIGLTRNKLHAFYVAGTFSAADFAIYAVATLNIPLIGQLSQTVGEVVVLENAEHHARGRRGEMRRVWHRATTILGLVLIPIFVVAEVFAPEIIRTLFGSPYEAATPIFRVFLLGLPLAIFLGSPMLRATRDLGTMVVADGISLGVTIAVLALLAGPFGPLGAVASLVAGRATFMLAASQRTARRLGLGVRDFLPWSTLARIFLLSAVGAVAARFLVDVIPLPVPVRLLLGGFLGTILFAAMAWFARLVPESERKLLRQLAERLQGRVAGGVTPPADVAE